MSSAPELDDAANLQVLFDRVYALDDQVFTNKELTFAWAGLENETFAPALICSHTGQTESAAMQMLLKVRRKFAAQSIGQLTRNVLQVVTDDGFTPHHVNSGLRGLRHAYYLHYGELSLEEILEHELAFETLDDRYVQTIAGTIEVGSVTNLASMLEPNPKPKALNKRLFEAYGLLGLRGEDNRNKLVPAYLGLRRANRLPLSPQTSDGPDNM